MMRTVLLALSRNRALAERLPRYRFARSAVRRFMPGEDLDAALAATGTFVAHGISTMLTLLGENLENEGEAATVAAHYRDALDRIAARGLDACISVKLTQLGLDLDEALARMHVDELCAHAARHGNVVWVDIESSDYVDRTLALFHAVSAQHRNVGLCLQAYLKRTAADLEALLATTAAIRLVKGAYAEPASIAYTRKADVDASYERLAGRLLAVAATHADAPSPALATHDTRLLARVVADAERRGITRDAYEVQMLYGIRSAEQRRLAAEGHRMRVLISYGPAWFPWFMRRLAERPANVWFVARNLVSR
jgi:proline dehydrogenase